MVQPLYQKLLHHTMIHPLPETTTNITAIRGDGGAGISYNWET